MRSGCLSGPSALESGAVLPQHLMGSQRGPRSAIAIATRSKLPSGNIWTKVWFLFSGISPLAAARNHRSIRSRTSSLVHFSASSITRYSIVAAPSTRTRCSHSFHRSRPWRNRCLVLGKRVYLKPRRSSDRPLAGR